MVREIEGPDWLDFYLPMGSLAAIYGSRFDIDARSRKRWQRSVDNWLAELGMYIFEAIPFSLGLIGHEVSGQVYAKQLARQAIPDVRYIGYLWPQNGKPEYFSMNRQYG
jgi:hypothetical protein